MQADFRGSYGRGLTLIWMLAAMGAFGAGVDAQLPLPSPIPPAALPAPRPAIVPAALLTIVPENGLQRVGPGSARWNAGEVDPATTPHLERVFTLQNETAKPIVIGQLRGSCGCETILLTKDNVTLRQVSLLPGEKAQMRVSIRMAGQHSGEMHKMAWAYAPGNTTPIATIDIALSVRALVLAVPSLLTFGAFNGVANTSLPLTVSMDASLARGGNLPPLVSSNPQISVVPEGKPQLLDKNGKPWIEQKYRVAMQGQPQSGPISGALRFVPAANAGTGIKPVPALTFSIPLVGEVSGGMAFAPKTVYFGSLVGGQGAKRQALLSGGAAEKLQNATLSTSSPWVTAALVPNRETPPGSRTAARVVEVTLKPDTPTGTLQAQVIVTMPTGEKLLLPVIAEVTAKR